MNTAAKFSISFALIFAGELVFRIRYFDMDIENWFLYLIFAALLATVVTVIWKQGKKT